MISEIVGVLVDWLFVVVEIYKKLFCCRVIERHVLSLITTKMTFKLIQ